MRIYLDDNIADGLLVVLLRKAGHEVVVPDDVGNSGVADPQHLTFAIDQGIVLMTRDYDDFTDLHDLIVAAGGSHPGILLVRSDNDPTRDMTSRGIVTAIGKLAAAGLGFVDQCHTLNQWR